MYHFTVTVRPWNYGRFSWENTLIHLLHYCFGIWFKNDCCDIWEDTGVRVFGIEFNLRNFYY